ncbi:hypothetical protein SAMN05428988_0255 [Chitinophaga sp. YR573]|uniref:hypothetical protein n=1 Tax=Chitinophaga sp. YR573 TaxID=1881040 RepID=UPI0008AF2740|nr:hypothetical protein [Chitinophaga sp. YR573]SEV89855.1 hypothetical protein SAMN05428988_0255 [Chitinophaga sp. YR573]
MPKEQPSIFDNNFIQETLIRRRRLMPLALKIYVWFFMLLPFLSWASSSYFFLNHEISYNVGSIKGLLLVTAFGSLLLPALRFLCNLFILLEKKWAILFALTITIIDIVFLSYSSINILYLVKAGLNGILILNICWCVLETPYLIMLFKIKGDWEKTPSSINHPDPSIK